jgi:hypothetical protein
MTADELLYHRAVYYLASALYYLGAGERVLGALNTVFAATLSSEEYEMGEAGVQGH